MPKYEKPLDINKVWGKDADTNLIRPDDTYIYKGWEQVKPPYQYENWIQNQQSQFQAYINQLGIPEWDANTEYQAKSSYVQGSNGKVYQAIKTSTNRNPISAGNETYWEETSLTRTASESKPGIIPIATYEQAKNGVDTSSAITPATLKLLLAASGLGEEIINPAGAVIMFAGGVPPTGYMECDGRELDRGEYIILYNAIGTRYGTGDGSTTFNIPDLRGQFVRGWDHGKGVDAGRALGSSQDSENKAHTHTGSASSAGSHSHSASTSSSGSHSHTLKTGRFGVDPATGGTVSYGSGEGGLHSGSSTSGGSIQSGGSHSHTVSVNSGGSHSHTVSVSSTGGSESRPKNIAMMYIIKT